MNKEAYYAYLRSLAWMLKKHELISIYLKGGWPIECYYCNTTDNLQVHHRDYEQVGQEDLTNGGVFQLAFLCRDCHHKWHFDSEWRKKKGNEIWDDFVKILEEEERLELASIPVT